MVGTWRLHEQISRAKAMTTAGEHLCTGHFGQSCGHTAENHGALGCTACDCMHSDAWVKYQWALARIEALGEELRPYRTLVIDGWSPPEETRRRENYIEELENRIECPQCGRLLQSVVCERSSQRRRSHDLHPG